MPIYEYECLACGKTTEAMQKFSDALLDTCPECGGQLKKLISNTTFVLKGSGWYVTDYGRKDSGTAKKSSESDKKSTGSKETETSTDVKAESKTDSAKEPKTETKKEPAAAS
ncbi:MAG: FmdB family zinc ribbon protein [Dissulfurispiraceae bacterium]